MRRVLNPSHIFVLALIVISLAIRLLPLLGGNIHFSFDQALDLLMTKQLVVDHKINLISRYSGLQGVLMGPFWTWLLSAPFLISGGSPLAGAVFLSLVSVASSLLIFLYFRRFLSPVAGWLLFIYNLFAPVAIANSQVVLSPNPLTFLFPLFIICLIQLTLGKSRYWPPLLFLLGVFFQLEIAFAAFTIPAVVLVLILFRHSVSRDRKPILIGLALLILTFLPQGIFDLRHRFLITGNLLQFATAGGHGLYQQADPLMSRIPVRIGSFFEDFGSMALFAKPWPLTLLIGFLSLSGWLLILRDKAVKEIRILKISGAVLAAFYIGFMFYPGAIWSWYRAGLPIIFIFLVIVPLARLSKISRHAGYIIPLIAVIPILQTVIPAVNLLSLSPAGGAYRGTAHLASQEMVLDYIYASAAGRKFSYYVYTPPVYDYVWQYDFWWYGQRKYGYLPDNYRLNIPLLQIGESTLPPKTGTGLFFLIIEPNLKEPWAPNGWLETYIKVGKVLDQKTYYDGLTIQKRIS